MPVTDPSPATAVERALTILEVVAGRREGLTNSELGRRLFVHSTSVGKVLLAWRPKEEVEEILRAQGLKKRTPKTITGITRLMAELETVRRNGYAVDDEENSLGARCVAAPIYDPAGNVIAALGVSGTLTQMEEAQLVRIVEAVKEATRRISRQLVRTCAAGPA